MQRKVFYTAQMCDLYLLCRQPVIRSVSSDFRHDGQATLASQSTRAHCPDTTAEMVLQAISLENDAELVCGRRAVAVEGQSDQGVHQ